MTDVKKLSLISAAAVLLLANSPMQSSAQSNNPASSKGTAKQSVTAIAKSSPAANEAAAQLQSDKAALQRALKRLEADEATLKSDTASVKMSAESKDAMKVYTDAQAIKGEKKDIAADKLGSLQMKGDKAALQRALSRLEADEATLKSDTASGRMSAESKDAMKAYIDEQAVKGEKKDIAADKTKVTR
jgi:hypothetical protein